MNKVVLLFALLIGLSSTAQHVIEGNYRSMGMGANYMYNINDAALNSNPSLLGWQSKYYSHKFDIGFKDFWVATYSPVASFGVQQLLNQPLDIEDDEGGDFTKDALSLFVWDELMISYDYGTQSYYTYDTTVSREVRQDYKESLMKQNSLKMNNTILACTYTSDNSGTFSFKINTETTSKFKLSEKFADLWAFGKTSSYFDTLVLIDGTHLANSPENYTNAILSQAYLGFSTDTLTISDIMDGSQFEFMKTRNYSLGWGKEYDYKKEDVRLFIGANLNIIEGLRYIQIKENNGELIISNFDKGEFVKNPISNAGYGASISFSGTAEYKEKWLMSAGVNNLGAINWRYKERTGGIGVFSNGNDNKDYASYTYGVSPTTFFNDQLQEEANFNWDEVNVDLGVATIYRATAANCHFGFKRQFGKLFSIGANTIQPINKKAVGSIASSYYGVSYELTLKKFSIFSGINNMNQSVAMPIGFSIGSRTSKLEAGLSVSDLLGYFDKHKTTNFSIGFGLKYRIW